MIFVFNELGYHTISSRCPSQKCFGFGFGYVFIVLDRIMNKR